MRSILYGMGIAVVAFLIGVSSADVGAQNFDPSIDVDVPMFGWVMIGAPATMPGTLFDATWITDANGNRMFLGADDVPTPQNVELVATFDAQCVTGGKSCKVPLKIYKFKP